MRAVGKSYGLIYTDWGLSGLPEERLKHAAALGVKSLGMREVHGSCRDEKPDDPHVRHEVHVE